MSENANLKSKKRSKQKLRHKKVDSTDNNCDVVNENDTNSANAECATSLPQQKKPKITLSNHGRDYSGDLKDYLLNWNNRNKVNSSWKFSKVIQSWALQNSFDAELIPVETFEMLIPYIATTQGAARDRIHEAATVVANEDNDEDDNNILRKQRAAEILQVLSQYIEYIYFII